MNALVLLASVLAGVVSAGVGTAEPSATVDWQRGVVRVLVYEENVGGSRSGRATLPAGAEKALWKAVAAVRIDSGTTVSSCCPSFAIFRERLRGSTTDWTVERPRPGLAVLSAPLAGRSGVLQAVLNDRRAQEKPRPRPASHKRSRKSPVQTKRTATSLPLQATGIIIDASKYGFRPVLIPRITAQDGPAIFDISKTDIEVVRETAMVGYAHTLAEARGYARVGNKPIVVEVTAVQQERGELILPDTEVERLRGLRNLAELLKQCRVVVVTG